MKGLINTVPFFVLVVGYFSMEASYSSPPTEGIAIVVNGKPITFIDISRREYSQEAEYQKMYQGDELRRQLKNLKIKTANDLIDRQLIINEFYNLGLWIPDSYVDKIVQAKIKDQYEGKEERFLDALAIQGETLDEFRATIVENAIIVAMTKRNIDDKIAGSMGGSSETERESLRSEWLASLRKSAFIEYMW